MKKFSLYLFMLVSLLFVSCSDDNDSKDEEPLPKPDVESTFTVNFSLTLPEDTVVGKLNDVVLYFKDVNTGKKTSYPQKNESEIYEAKVKKGFYDVNVEANYTYTFEGKKVTSKVNGYKQSIQVLQDLNGIKIPLFFENQESGFVLAELFFTGTKTPQGSQYYADKFFVIYNNSDHVLYADSLAITESKFLTVSKADYQPNIMDEAMAVQAVYMIPGNGKTHPVEPGGSILICDNALDHTKANPNSFDLTKADFEWVDESTNPNVSDVNNPNVPDLKKVYCYTATIWSPHTQGFCSYALAKIKTDLDDYIVNYTYNFDYIVVGQTGESPMTGRCYKIPNSWIVDAVNLSVPAMFQWIVVDPSLDRGWSYCAEFGWDSRRFGKSVRRKVVSHTEDGRAILKDTNNSTVDFESEQVADPYHKF